MSFDQAENLVILDLEYELFGAKILESRDCISTQHKIDVPELHHESQDLKLSAMRW